MKKQYAVIGLGRFGSHLARALYDEGNEVIGIDLNEEKVEAYQDSLSQAFIADSTEEASMKSLGLRNFDVVIVAIGDDMESSILTVVLLKELEVPYVVAKALSKRHGLVLTKVGADQVVFPERDMGLRLAKRLMHPNIIEHLKLSDDYSVEEIKIPSSLVGTSIQQLNIRKRYRINVIAIRHKTDKMSISPHPTDVLTEGDLLVVIGTNDDLKSFSDTLENQ
ncbi:TrkA-N domain-containing protein [Fictibacillus macauensis ZFHKF-1]|uniref:TrkA-N domain-containing protein n=1 Tax=Fictibacillus macauensis ZFHKF-1 TaxID=1196324 RepID=I8UHY2_9BACL|nr:TrkA family potassium uptake protein [Fictibacillus macauensis]EIT86480.1 TrkA-N domain-containing protein [Fictibacillus macauensis ZFHKF-1]